MGLMIVLLLTSLADVAQVRSFTKNDIEFVLDLPSPGEDFEGNFKGIVSAYEYTRSGRPMAGRTII